MADASAADVAGWITELARRMRLSPDEPDRAQVGIDTLAQAGIDTLAQAGIDPNMTMDRFPSADSLMQGIRGMDAPAQSIDYGAPMAGTRSLAEGLPSVFPESERGFYRDPERPTTGIALGPQSSQEAFDLSRQGQDMAFVAGQAAPFAAGPAFGGIAQGANAVGRAVAQSPVGQAVGRAATAVGEHVARNAPRYGLSGAAGGTLATTATPQDIPAPSSEDRATLQSLQTELGKWQDQLKTLQTQRKQAADAMEAQQRGTGGAKPGFGPIFKAQQENLQSLDKQIGAINDSIRTTNEGITQARNRMSPEYRMKLERDRLEQEERDRQRRSQMTTRELASDYLGYLPALSIPAAIVSGGILRGRALSNWNRQIGDIDRRWGQAIERANAATPGSSAFNQAMAEAERHMANFERIVHRGKHAGSGAAVGVGAGLGFVGATLPEEIDLARAALGSDLWKQLKDEVIKDLPTFGMYMAKAGLSTALGGAAGHLGRYPVDMTRINRGAPGGHAAETEGLRRATPPIPLEPIPMSPQLPPAASSPPALPPGMAIPGGPQAGPRGLQPPAQTGGGAPEPNVTFGPPRFESGPYRLDRPAAPPSPPPAALSRLDEIRRPMPAEPIPPPVPTGGAVQPRPGWTFEGLPDYRYRRSNPNPEPGSGGHYVPPTAPATPGETWVSPMGQNEVYRDNLNRWWQRIRGGPAKPRKEGPPDNYRRISAVSDPFDPFGGYPVG